ncbi:MAG: YibE/F family protein [Clostridia bacterium]|nr:YibE/F family protein [Clostridia bacterium]
MLFSVRKESNGTIRAEMYGYNREGFVYGLIALFFAVLIIIGRKKGLYSILSLVFTVVIIVFFMVPRITEGRSPIIASIITAALTTAVTISMVSGVNAKSLAAVIGIVLGVATAGGVSMIAGRIAHISGLHTQHASEMIYLSQEIGIRVPELLFAGIIIASLGAVMDVGMSIASSVFEVYSVDRRLSLAELYRSGMNVGRDIIGTMSNTLILAFAGSSLNTLIIIVLYKLPYIRFINLDLLGVELIQGISGSIGLVLTVPITALCAAFLVTKKGVKG